MDISRLVAPGGIILVVGPRGQLRGNGVGTHHLEVALQLARVLHRLPLHASDGVQNDFLQSLRRSWIARQHLAHLPHAAPPPALRHMQQVVRHDAEAARQSLLVHEVQLLRHHLARKEEAGAVAARVIDSSPNGTPKVLYHVCRNQQPNALKGHVEEAAVLRAHHDLQQVRHNQRVDPTVGERGCLVPTLGVGPEHRQGVVSHQVPAVAKLQPASHDHSRLDDEDVGRQVVHVRQGLQRGEQLQVQLEGHGVEEGRRQLLEPVRGHKSREQTPHPPGVHLVGELRLEDGREVVQHVQHGVPAGERVPEEGAQADAQLLVGRVHAVLPQVRVELVHALVELGVEASLLRKDVA
mmetsp:Transcript_13875/g.26644  ORF Transcript_13875/g.26644 Transcript_13875/m.26644 type:complete len:352 (-) Transcript_13875:547-1602(-)